MNRPFLSLPLDKLIDAAARALAANDTQTLDMVKHELTFRNTSKAVSFLNRLTASTASIPKAVDLPPNRRKPEFQVSKAKKAPPLSKPSGAKISPRIRSVRKPTPEQDQAVRLFSQGRSLKINAFAGTGKTSTLEMLSHSTSQRGQYLAFNRDIVKDARDKFPSTVNCATTHGLAFRSMAPRYDGRIDKLTGKMNANQLAQVFDLETWRIDEHRVLKPQSQGALILDTIRRFAMSADPEPLLHHVPLYGALGFAPDVTKHAVQQAVLRGASLAWARMCDARNPMPLGHDGYLKLWTLERPSIAADFILLDEAQDTNPAVLDLLERQSCQSPLHKSVD